MVMMNPNIDNFDFCIDTGAFATRCKEITTDPKKDVVEETNDDGMLSEKDLLTSEQANMKS